MNEQIEVGVADTDDMLISTLRTCGFFVRQIGLLEVQRPQVLGSIDNATAFFKLAVAGADAARGDVVGQRAGDAEEYEIDHGETVLRVQKALGITDTGWVSPDIVIHYLEKALTQRAASQPKAIGYAPDYLVQRLKAGDPGVMVTITANQLPAHGVNTAIYTSQPDSTRDAARYRWLVAQGFKHAWSELTSDSDGDPHTNFKMEFSIPEFHAIGPDDTEMRDWTPEEICAAIDAAMAAQQGEKGGVA